jgi:hypothetical protein
MPSVSVKGNTHYVLNKTFNNFYAYFLSREAIKSTGGEDVYGQFVLGTSAYPSSVKDRKRCMFIYDFSFMDSILLSASADKTYLKIYYDYGFN